MIKFSILALNNSILLFKSIKRKILFILLFGFCAAFGYGQKSAENNATIKVEVVLVDTLTKIPPLPYCGILEVNSITLKYKVIKVLKGKYKAKTILIKHSCPRELIEKKILENNKKYVYTLTQNKNLLKTNNEVVYEIIE